MMHSRRAGLAATIPAAALLLLSGQALAQQQITAEDAESYLHGVRDEAVEIMDSQAFDRILEWTETNIADGAVLQASIAMMRDGRPNGFASFTMEKDDLLRLGGVLMTGAPQPGIEDYALEVEVGEVIPHGDGAATARVTWTESFTIVAPDGGGMAPAPDGAEAAGDAAATDGAPTFEGTADCVHLLQREGDRLAIGLTTCTGELRH